MRTAILTSLALLVLTIVSPPAGAQQGSAVLLVNLPAQARLSFSSTSVTFPDADPDVAPLVSSVPSGVTINARARVPRNSQVTLTLHSIDDLRSGVTVLPASLVTWTAAGAGFRAGTLRRGAPQLLGLWNGSGAHTGMQSFRFENRWTHPAGTYSATFVYTLATP
jgi:hypothetical protein